MVGTDLEARIRERAYQIWEREGRPHGRHLEHWRRAEQEVKAQAGQTILQQSVEAPNPVPRMSPASPAAARAPGATAEPGAGMGRGTAAGRGAQASTPLEAGATAQEAKRTVKRKQTQSETKAPRVKRPRTTTPKSTD